MTAAPFAAVVGFAAAVVVAVVVGVGVALVIGAVVIVSVSRTLLARGRVAHRHTPQLLLGLERQHLFCFFSCGGGGWCVREKRGIGVAGLYGKGPSLSLHLSLSSSSSSSLSLSSSLPLRLVACM